MIKPRLARAGAALGLLTAATALSGCSYDYWVRFQYLTAAPPEVVVEYEGIQMKEGLAAAVVAIPMQDDRELGDDIPVDLVSRRNNILGVDHGLERQQFVLYGVQPGSTLVDAYFEDNFIGEIPAIVDPQ